MYFNCSRSAASKYDLERFRKIEFTEVTDVIDSSDPLNPITTYIPTNIDTLCSITSASIGKVAPVYYNGSDLTFSADSLSGGRTCFVDEAGDA